MRSRSDVNPAVSMRGSWVAPATLRRLPLGLEDRTDADVARLAEVVMRTIQSYVLHPGDVPHPDDDLRALLHLALLPLAKEARDPAAH